MLPKSREDRKVTGAVTKQQSLHKKALLKFKQERTKGEKNKSMNPALGISTSSSSSSGAEGSLLGAVPLSSALGAGGAASPQQDARASPAVKPRCCCCWKRRHRSSATETKGTEVPNKSQGERWPKHSPETSSFSQAFAASASKQRGYTTAASATHQERPAHAV